MEKKVSLDLTQRFIKGLKQYDLTPEEMVGWFYCGGRNGNARHYNYFKMLYPDDEFPSLTNECICGHNIKENCYITNEDYMLVLGNCCIKRFLPNENSGRTCEICKKPHKNRKNNRCNDCRVGLCNDCGKESYYPKCRKCYFNK
jgi:hypothetical protein